VHLAKPNRSDEVEHLPGSGRLPKDPCCHLRRRHLCELDSVEKERAAASTSKTRSPHRPSCSRHVRKQRRPSTEMRLGVNFALQRHGPSLLGFFVPRSRFASGRDPPDAHRVPGYKPCLRLTRGAFSDKGSRLGSASRVDPADGAGGKAPNLGDDGSRQPEGVSAGMVALSPGPPGRGQALSRGDSQSKTRHRPSRNRARCPQ
jgi:hypothetical protein